MRRWLSKGFVLVVILLIFLASCAPTASPSPGVAPQAPESGVSREAITSPTSSIQPLTPQDSTWNRIIEAAKKEGTVTVYSYWWVGDESINISRAFRQKYGIDVQIVTGKGAEFLERLKVEKRIGKITADVFEGSATHSQNTKEDGLLGTVAELPMLQEKSGWNVTPLIFDPTATILLHRPWTMVPHVNTKLVKPEEAPKTWDDVLLPKWKGKMIVPDPRVTNLTYYLWLLVNNGFARKDFIPQLAQQDLKFVRDSSDAARALARGEVSLIPNMTDSNVARFALEGAPVKAVEVDKGTIVSGGVINWVKDGPHPNAAKLFINWVLSDEGQTVESSLSATMPMRQNAPDNRHPALKVRVNNPLVIGVKENEDIAKAFRDKVIVDVLMKGQ